MIYFQWHFICSSAGWFLPSGTLFDSRCMIHSQWHFIRIPAVSFIPSGTLRTKSNAKYSTHFLLPGVTKGFKRNRNSRYEIIRKRVSLKIQVNPLMNLWWSLYFKQSCTYQLIKNLTKNEYYPRSASRVLPLF